MSEVEFSPLHELLQQAGLSASEFRARLANAGHLIDARTLRRYLAPVGAASYRAPPPWLLAAARELINKDSGGEWIVGDDELGRRTVVHAVPPRFLAIMRARGIVGSVDWWEDPGEDRTAWSDAARRASERAYASSHRAKTSGYRQLAWDYLREQPCASVSALASAVGGSAEGLRSYVAELERRGYVERSVTGGITLIKDTGPRSPSWSVHTGEFRDWNLDPGMTAQQLGEIVKSSGLPLSGWLEKHGFSGGGATRLRQMIEGQRPVSKEIARAAGSSS